MKKALFVVLIVVVVVTGLPLVMGTPAMAACQDCGPAVAVAQSCTVAVLAAAGGLVLALIALRLRSREEIVRLLLLGSLLERPPRLA